MGHTDMVITVGLIALLLPTLIGCVASFICWHAAETAQLEGAFQLSQPYYLRPSKEWFLDNMNTHRRFRELQFSWLYGGATIGVICAVLALIILLTN